MHQWGVYLVVSTEADGEFLIWEGLEAFYSLMPRSELISNEPRVCVGVSEFPCSQPSGSTINTWILPPLCGPQQEYDHKKDVQNFNFNSFSIFLIFTLPRFAVSMVLPLALFWTFLSSVVYFSQLYASLQFFLNCEILMESKWHQWCVAEKWFSPASRSLLAIFLIIFPHIRVSVMPPCFIYDRLWACFWHLTSVFLWRFFCFPGFIFSCMHTGVETAYPRKKNCPDVMPVCRCLMSLSACAPDFKSYFCCLQSSYRTNKSQ